MLNISARFMVAGTYSQHAEDFPIILRNIVVLKSNIVIFAQTSFQQKLKSGNMN